MNEYRVTLRHEHGYNVTVTISAPDTTTAKAQALAMHPGHEFVSVVLQES